MKKAAFVSILMREMD